MVLEDQEIEIMTTKEFFGIADPLTTGWVFLCDGEPVLQLCVHDVGHTSCGPGNKYYMTESTYQLLWEGCVDRATNFTQHISKLLDFKFANKCTQFTCGIYETERILIEAYYLEEISGGKFRERSFAFYDGTNANEDWYDRIIRSIHKGFAIDLEDNIKFTKLEIDGRRMIMWANVGTYQDGHEVGFLAPWTAYGFPLDMLVPYIQETSSIKLNQKLIRQTLDLAFEKAKEYFE